MYCTHKMRSVSVLLETLLPGQIQNFISKMLYDNQSLIWAHDGNANQKKVTLKKLLYIVLFIVIVVKTAKNDKLKPL